MKNTKHPEGKTHQDCGTCGSGDSVLCMCCNPWLADLPIGFGAIKKDRADFERAVMAIFQQAECTESLMWRVLEDRTEFSVNVSDTFMWGCADSEEIAYQDLPLLVRTWVDLKEVDGLIWLPELFAARKRGVRPQGAAYPSGLEPPGLKELFDACGPQRQQELGNPLSRKKPDRDLVLFLNRMALMPHEDAMELFDAIRIDRGQVLAALSEWGSR